MRQPSSRPLKGGESASSLNTNACVALSPRLRHFGGWRTVEKEVGHRIVEVRVVAADVCRCFGGALPLTLPAGQVHFNTITCNTHLSMRVARDVGWVLGKRRAFRPRQHTNVPPKRLTCRESRNCGLCRRTPSSDVGLFAVLVWSQASGRQLTCIHAVLCNDQLPPSGIKPGSH